MVFADIKSSPLVDAEDLARTLHEVFGRGVNLAHQLTDFFGLNRLNLEIGLARLPQKTVVLQRYSEGVPQSG